MGVDGPDARILDALRAHDDLLDPGRRLCVGFSGGLDSTVLLHGLVRGLGLGVVALHANHGLHGDAGRWQQHCLKVCERLGTPLRSARLSVERGGRGLEAAAREARYAWFAEQLQPGDLLLLAHHQDDQVETLLLRLLRGAGPDGLGAMAARRPFTAATLLRPFLGIPRTALASYAQRHGLSWVDDPSNDDDHFDRNYLRHRVLPSLEARWPSYRDSLARAARLTRELVELPDSLVPALCHSVAGDPGFSIADLPLPVPAAALALRAWLRDRGLALPGHDLLHEFLRQLREGGGAELGGDGWALTRYRDAVFARVLVPQPSVDMALRVGEELDIPGVGRVTLEEPAGGARPPHGGALRLRLRRGGEALETVTGRHRALKSVFQEYAVPPWWRARVPLLFVEDDAGSELVAVGSFAASPRLQRQGLRLRWTPAPIVSGAAPEGIGEAHPD